MENNIQIAWLNDFIFCPKSIYLHNLLDDADRIEYQEEAQINGSHAHHAVDSGAYSERTDILSGISVYSEKYNLSGKIDLFDKKNGILTERKKKIKTVYDGYVYQLYGQITALREMGYEVRRARLHSMDDNKNYDVSLPEDDPVKLRGFTEVIAGINSFDPGLFRQTCGEKCAHCIYSQLCDSCVCGGGQIC